jgi:hypothetical protein
MITRGEKEIMNMRYNSSNKNMMGNYSEENYSKSTEKWSIEQLSGISRNESLSLWGFPYEGGFNG